MKRILMTAFVSYLFSLPLQASAQETENDYVSPKWVCNKGYWVAESNLNQPAQVSVSFYSNEHVKLGTKKMEGNLNFKKRKTLLLMKTELENAWRSYEKAQVAATNQLPPAVSQPDTVLNKAKR